MEITKFTDFILFETPLPADWDKEVYTKNVSFKKKIEYAIARAEKIGSGSSRIAFEIEYKGRPTILKIAKNPKGLAQNKEEADILSDNSVSSICIPIIDYDEDNDEPIWLHCEKADKATAAKLCKAMCVPDLQTLVLAANGNGNAMQARMSDSARAEIENFNADNDAKLEIAYEYIDELAELAANFNVELGDFKRPANWGFYKGEPVVIDVGFTEYTKLKYYSK